MDTFHCFFKNEIFDSPYLNDNEPADPIHLQEDWFRLIWEKLIIPDFRNTDSALKKQQHENKHSKL